MKIFVAGATGALGRQLVPLLVARGHEVVGMTRTPSKQGVLRELGATPVVADALNPDQVARAVAQAEPDVIVHELTALSGDLDLRNVEATFEQTNRLRTEGTDYLLAAGRAVGVKRFVAQSFGAWTFNPSGGRVVTEEHTIIDPPLEALRALTGGIRHLESAVLGAEWTEGIVLRYGGFYGPGTSLEPGGVQTEAIRSRKFPVIGDGSGVWSFMHVEDGAEATVAAIERGRPGIYNIVDDFPAPVAEWLPAAAAALGAKPPRHVPRWFGRLVAGEPIVFMMTEVSGASNAKAKAELGWEPRHRSLAETLAEESGGRKRAAA